MEPIRCVTCGAVLRFQEFERRVHDQRQTMQIALNEMGVSRFCCRRMYVSHPTELEALIRSFPLKDFEVNDYSLRFSRGQRIRTVDTD